MNIYALFTIQFYHWTNESYFKYVSCTAPVYIYIIYMSYYMSCVSLILFYWYWRYIWNRYIYNYLLSAVPLIGWLSGSQLHLTPCQACTTAGRCMFTYIGEHIDVLHYYEWNNSNGLRFWSLRIWKPVRVLLAVGQFAVKKMLLSVKLS